MSFFLLNILVMTVYISIMNEDVFLSVQVLQNHALQAIQPLFFHSSMLLQPETSPFHVMQIPNPKSHPPTDHHSASLHPQPSCPTLRAPPPT